MLTGFLPRGRSRLFAGVDETVLFAATDTGHRWLLRIGENVTAEREPELATADWAVSGTAADLYLGLWNRGAEVHVPAEFVTRWRSAQRVRWN